MFLLEPSWTLLPFSGHVLEPQNPFCSEWPKNWHSTIVLSCSLTSEEYRRMISALALLATVFLIQSQKPGQLAGMDGKHLMKFSSDKACPQKGRTLQWWRLKQRNWGAALQRQASILGDSCLRSCVHWNQKKPVTPWGCMNKKVVQRVREVIHCLSWVKPLPDFVFSLDWGPQCGENISKVEWVQHRITNTDRGWSTGPKRRGWGTVLSLEKDGFSGGT